MSSHQIIYEVHIDTPRGRVWEVVADFGNVANSSPLIAASKLTSAVAGGVGATRHCDFAMMGATTEEKIVDWVEGETLGIEITKITRMPLVVDQSAVFRLADDGDGMKLNARLNYSTRFGLIGQVVNAMMMRRMLDKGWRSYLAGIKYHAETGSNVDQKTELPIDVVTAAG